MPDKKQLITPLSPNARLNHINTWDYRTFEDFWEEVLKTEEIHNVAITGGFGIGKTSMLESYEQKKLRPRRKYLHVTLSRYIKKDKQPGEDIKRLEFELLRQVTSRFGSRDLPFATAETIADHRKLKWERRLLGVWASLLVLCVFLLTVQEPQEEAVHAVGEVRQIMEPLFYQLYNSLFPFVGIANRLWAFITKCFGLLLKAADYFGEHWIDSLKILIVVGILARIVVWVVQPKIEWIEKRDQLPVTIEKIAIKKVLGVLYGVAVLWGGLTFLGCVLKLILFLAGKRYESISALVDGLRSFLEYAPYWLFVVAGTLYLMEKMPLQRFQGFRLLEKRGVIQVIRALRWGCVGGFVVFFLFPVVPKTVNHFITAEYTSEEVIALIHGVAYWLLLGLLVIGCYVAVRKVFAWLKVKSLSVSLDRAQVEMEKVSIDPLDKYGYELIYDLEAVADKIGHTVVFDDMDRLNIHDCIGICQRLRELNVTLNQRRKGRKPIRFVFIVNDEIIGRIGTYTKFFDYVLPVYPSVSSEYMIKKWTDEFIPEIGLDKKLDNYPYTKTLLEEAKEKKLACLMDYRIVHSIQNEYRVLERLEGHRSFNAGQNEKEEQDGRLLFAIYKVLFPLDYYELRTGQSVLYCDANKRREAMHKIGNYKTVDSERNKYDLLIFLWERENNIVSTCGWEQNKLIKLYEKYAGKSERWENEIDL